MSEIGAFALRFAFLGALYAAIVALLGVRLGRRELIWRAEPAKKLNINKASQLQIGMSMNPIAGKDICR